MKKRLVSVLLSLSMVFTMLPTPVWATEAAGGQTLSTAQEQTTDEDLSQEDAPLAAPTIEARHSEEEGSADVMLSVSGEWDSYAWEIFFAGNWQPYGSEAQLLVDEEEYEVCGFRCTVSKDGQSVTTDPFAENDEVWTTEGGTDTYTTTHSHPVCGESCSHGSHDELEWQEWVKTDTLPTTPGNYYLTRDVILNRPVTMENVNLCLNGHTITVRYAIEVDSTVSITNCGDTGAIARAGDNIRVLDGYGNLSVYHTTIDGKGVKANPPMICVRGQALFEDCVLQNAVRTEAAGAALVVDMRGSATLTNTQVQNNVVSCCGAGIFVQPYGTLVMNGGSLTGNSCTTPPVYSMDASALFVDTSSTATLNNVVVSGNTGTDNAIGVYGSLTLNNCRVYDNQNCEVYLDVDYSDSSKLYLDGSTVLKKPLTIKYESDDQTKPVVFFTSKLQNSITLRYRYGKANDSSKMFAQGSNYTITEEDMAFIAPYGNYAFGWNQSENGVYYVSSDSADGYRKVYLDSSIPDLQVSVQKDGNTVSLPFNGQGSYHGRLKPGTYKVLVNGEDLGQEITVRKGSSFRADLDLNLHEHPRPDGPTTIWSVWDQTDALPNTPGNYVLENDVELTSTWDVPGSVALCLNGHTISCLTDEFGINNSYELEITDCTGSGKIIGDSGSPVFTLFRNDDGDLYLEQISVEARGGEIYGIASRRGHVSLRNTTIQTTGFMSSVGVSGKDTMIEIGSSTIRADGSRSAVGVRNDRGADTRVGASTIEATADSKARGIELTESLLFLRSGNINANARNTKDGVAIYNTAGCISLFDGDSAPILSGDGMDIYLGDHALPIEIRGGARNNSTPYRIYSTNPGIFTDRWRGEENHSFVGVGGETIIPKDDELSLAEQVITYQPGDDGEGDPQIVGKRTHETIPLAGALFDRYGYDQIGWQTEDGQEYELGAPYSGLSVTLYPVWTPTPSVTPDLEMEELDIIVTYGESKTLRVNVLNESDDYRYEYQWFSCDENKDHPQLIDGATDASYDTWSEHRAGSYYYYVEVWAERKDNGQAASTTTDVAKVTVKKATLTPTIESIQPKTYDGTTTGAGAIRLEGAVNNEAPTASASFVFADKNAGDHKEVTATVTLDEEWRDCYTLSTDTLTGYADIVPKSVTIHGVAGQNKVYDATTQATANTDEATIEDLVSGDQVTVTANAVFRDKNVGSQTMTLSLGLEGPDAQNYVLDQANSQQSTTATIQPKPIRVLVKAADKVYNRNADAEISAVVDEEQLVDDAVITIRGLKGTFASSNAGTHLVTIDKSGCTVTGDQNYELRIPDTAEATIEKAELTVVPKDSTITYGEYFLPFMMEYDCTGLLPGDDNALQGEPTYTSTYRRYDNVGSYPISMSGVTAQNYNIHFDEGTLTVKPKVLTIVWGSTDLVYNRYTQAPEMTLEGAVNQDKLTYTVKGGQINAGTGYVATAALLTAPNVNNYTLPEDCTTTFTIHKAAQPSPDEFDLSIQDETIAGKNDGGFSSPYLGTFEYRKRGDAAWRLTGEHEGGASGLASGVYEVRFPETNNFEPSPSIFTEIKPGVPLKVSLPSNQTGYTLTADKTEARWNDSVTLTFALQDGYSKTDAFAVEVFGTPVTLNDDGTYTIEHLTSDVAVTVRGVADITAPTGTVKVADSVWNKFLHTITFGYFFNATQNVTVTAQDEGSGIAQTSVYVADTAMTQAEIEALADDAWTEYNGTFQIEPERECVVYAKLVDHAQNISYLSSDGLVFDSTAPRVIAIEDDALYYGTQTFMVTETNLKSVKIDGAPASPDALGVYKLVPKVGDYQIEVTDKANNTTTLTVTVRWHEVAVPTIDAAIYNGTTQTANVPLNPVLYEVSQNSGGVDAGDYPVTLTLKDTVNYKWATKDGGEANLGLIFTIQKAKHQISLPQTTFEKTYGDSTFHLYAAAGDDEAPITYESSDEDVLTVDENGVVTIHSAGDAEITAAMEETQNFTGEQKVITVSVAPKAITVTLDDKTKIYGDDDPDLTYSTDTALVGNDTLDTITLSRAAGEDKGTYAITAELDDANPNYDITLEEGTFTIEPKSIEHATVTLGEVLRHNGSSQKQQIARVEVDGVEVPATAYDVTGDTASEVGAHTMTITAKESGNFTGSLDWIYVIAPKSVEQIVEDENGNIVVGSGVIAIEVVNDGVNLVELNTDRAEVLDMLIESGNLTADELSLIAQGADVSVILTIQNEEAASESGKEALAQAASDKNYTVGSIIDICLYKRMNVNGAATDEQIFELSNALSISLEVADELLHAPNGYTRAYKMLRYHDGEVEWLDGSFDPATGIFTFTTDRFSDYALVYKDVKKPANKPGNGNSSNDSKPSSSAETGDNRHPFVWILLLLLSSASLLAVVCFKRKRKAKP